MGFSIAMFVYWSVKYDMMCLETPVLMRSWPLSLRLLLFVLEDTDDRVGDGRNAPPGT